MRQSLESRDIAFDVEANLNETVLEDSDKAWRRRAIVLVFRDLIVVSAQ
jgi:hypothetical protein